MPLKLQLLLRKDRRNQQASRAVQDLLAELGMRPTAAGAATVSAEIDPLDFERVFGRKPDLPAAQNPGAPQGFRYEPAEADLPVPDRLSDYVAGITLAPPHVRMSPDESS